MPATTEILGIVADGRNRSRTCQLCDRKIHRGQRITKDFETGWWVHTACKAQELDLDGTGAEEHRLQVQHFRDRVVDAVRCPRCSASVGANCRELGRERPEVHRQRITAADRASTVVLHAM